MQTFWQYDIFPMPPVLSTSEQKGYRLCMSSSSVCCIQRRQRKQAKRSAALQTLSTNLRSSCVQLELQQKFVVYVSDI